MKTQIVLVLVLLSLAGVAVAKEGPCTAAMVTAGLCRDAANRWLCYDSSTANAVRLRDAIALRYQWPATVPCESVRRFRPLLNGADSRVLVAAGVSADSCALGTTIANPQTETDFADRMIEKLLRDIVIASENQTSLDAVDPATVPDPDVGAP